LARLEERRRRYVLSDEAARRISELRAHGFVLAEIAAAAGPSLGVVHKASIRGNRLRRETAAAILELRRN
jgi:hypothetical protein